MRKADMYDTIIDTEHRRVVTTWGKCVTDEALLDYQKSVWSDPDLHGFDELIDFRALEDIDVSADGLEAVAHAAAGIDDTAGQSRVAVIVNEGLGFGLSRMYESFRELETKARRQVMTFKRMDEALKWLDEAPGGPGHTRGA
jgi:hypothetical protein